MDEIRGILFAVLKRKGTKSEGPEYYIKPIDDYQNRWSEITIWKKNHRWEKDPVLHEFLDKKVLIIGEIIETKSTITVEYSEVKRIE
ncbi:MAG: hypothetical protein ACXAAH_11955 [Promethearchaeota archaeon]|jgi:hypothetical protein